MTEQVLAWVGAVGGVLGGGAGLLFGILAFNQSKASNKLAEKAHQVAERGEQLSTKANDLAAESNGIAVDARQLAEEANTLSKRAEFRETELHDAQWEGDWEEPGSYVLTKTGQHEAFEVTATVEVDGVKETIAAGSVSEGGKLTFSFPRARQQFAQEVREKRQRDLRAAESPYGRFGIGSTGMEERCHTITERVLWKTQLGNPQTHETTNHFAALGDFD